MITPLPTYKLLGLGQVEPTPGYESELDPDGWAWTVTPSADGTLHVHAEGPRYTVAAGRARLEPDPDTDKPTYVLKWSTHDKKPSATAVRRALKAFTFHPDFEARMAEAARIAVQNELAVLRDELADLDQRRKHLLARLETLAAWPPAEPKRSAPKKRVCASCTRRKIRPNTCRTCGRHMCPHFTTSRVGYVGTCPKCALASRAQYAESLRKTGTRPAMVKEAQDAAARKERERVRAEERQAHARAAIDRIVSDPRAATGDKLQMLDDHTWSWFGEARIDDIKALPGGPEAIALYNDAIRAKNAEKDAQEEQTRAEETARKVRDLVQVRAFLVKHAQPEVVELFDEGRLAEKALVDLVRDHVFRELSDFPRYVRLQARDICHDASCPNPDRAKFEKAEIDELSVEEFRALKAIRQRAPEGAVCKTVLHTVRCREEDCFASKVERKSVLVSTTWHGRPLSREYALTPPRLTIIST